MESNTDTPELKSCVGRLEIARPKPLGFLCGSIPVSTDEAFHVFNSALVPSNQRVTAPRYRMIPAETDLNSLPLLSSIPEKVLPTAATEPRTGGDLPWENDAMTSNLARKAEALAVSGLVEYEDEIDVIAPTDILKQIFKIPYSKARLSIAVHRVGQTLVLNAGPDIEEGEKLIRRHNNQPKCADQSLFINFAMHSVRMEACDCPPTHRSPEEQQSFSSVLPGQSESRDGMFDNRDHAATQHVSHHSGENSDYVNEDEVLRHCSQQPHSKQDNLFWSRRKNKKNKSHDTDKKVSQVKEKQRCPIKESEKYKKVNNDAFLRVLLWQFHNFRMLLGSDMLIFSNEKYVSVSLHLWDVSRQVTPITWLEAWLDNVMASVPELAICYHQDGVVQGYELLKTDDIFLVKGISEDGSPAFHPHVVQQNGLSVLRFLQENCKQDPGAYWLYKSAGEDVIQLFDLSVISKKHSSNDCDDRSNSLPALIHRGRSNSVLSLGTLLYRIAHRLSLSMSPNSLARCVKFIRKCLKFLDEPDHLVVRAFAHEQFARVLLNYDEGLDLTSVSVESDVVIVDAEEESFGIFRSISESNVLEIVPSSIPESEPDKDTQTFQDFGFEVSARVTTDANASIPKDETDFKDMPGVQTSVEQNFFSQTSCASDVVESVTDPISSKLAAIHHVSQAIKSLRWKRQLQGTQQEQDIGNGTQDRLLSPINISVCACGDTDCIEVCDIQEWLLTSKLDDKLWKLVLLLGESYLALGQAYKEVNQLHQALKVLELACIIYGSMPQHLEDTKFISSMVCSKPTQVEVNIRSNMARSSCIDDATEVNYVTNSACITLEQFASPYFFWAKAWTLVGDIYVNFQVANGKKISSATRNPVTQELRMSSEVLKEVGRLKKKLGRFNQNCNSCSLVNCSCQSDRAESGSCASSSTGDGRGLGYCRKQNKKLYKSNPHSNIGFDDSSFESEHPKHCRYKNSREASDVRTDPVEDKARAGTYPREMCSMELHNSSSTIDKKPKLTRKVKNGGIFKYLCDPVAGDLEYNLSVAVSCYKEARKVLAKHPSGSEELQSIVKRMGWVCNELGRYWLERKELKKAELAFADAIRSFKEVSDHTNIILINCNLGHGRRALAEEMVSNIENLQKQSNVHNAYNQALDSAKLEYSESLRYYGAARAELDAISDDSEPVSNNLKNEVRTQYAHTYLKLGMLLGKEGTVAEVYENRVLEDYSCSSVKKTKKEHRKHEISANDAIREALSIYESLGDLRRQEAAYAYFQLGCYQRDCCLNFMDSDWKEGNISKGDDSILQRVKQYALLAERNWQQSLDFYGPKTHPIMYLTILIERSTLLFNLSKAFHSNAMLESALSRLLEGHCVSEEAVSTSLGINNPDICARFWSQLQLTLKKMLAMTLPPSASKLSTNSPQTPPNKSLDVGKLRELYRLSLKSTDFSQLHAMYSLWAS